MQIYKRWRQAITLSLLFHCFLLMAAGWLSAFAYAPPPQQTYMEMELINETAAPSPAAQTSPPLILPAANTDVIETTPMQTRAAVVAETETVAISPVSNPVAIAPAGATSDAKGQLENAGMDGSAEPVKFVILAPRILRKVDPVYPEQGRLEGWEGIVKVRFQVLTTGKTDTVQIESSSGFALLDEAAVDAVQQWQFIPAKNQATNQPMACWTYVTLAFKLNNGHSK